MSNKPWVQVDSEDERLEIEGKTPSHHRELPDLIIVSRDKLIDILQSGATLPSRRGARMLLRAAWTKGVRAISTELSLAYQADVPPMVIANAIASSYVHPYGPKHALGRKDAPVSIHSSNYQPRHLAT